MLYNLKLALALRTGNIIVNKVELMINKLIKSNEIINKDILNKYNSIDYLRDKINKHEEAIVTNNKIIDKVKSFYN